MTKMEKTNPVISGGTGIVEDSRVDGLASLVKNRSDSRDDVGRYYSRASAVTANGRPVETTSEQVVRKIEARLAFAEFASEMLGSHGTLDEQAFEFLLNEFQSREALNFSRSYAQLDSTAQGKYIEAIRSVKEDYLTAFSAASTEPELVMPSPAREKSLSFAAMPSTIEEAYACFDSFCTDAAVSKILSGTPLAEQFRAFKVARHVAGIIETPETEKAFTDFASEFALSK